MIVRLLLLIDPKKWLSLTFYKELYLTLATPVIYWVLKKPQTALTLGSWRDGKKTLFNICKKLELEDLDSYTSKKRKLDRSLKENANNAFIVIGLS